MRWIDLQPGDLVILRKSPSSGRMVISLTREEYYFNKSQSPTVTYYLILMQLWGYEQPKRITRYSLPMDVIDGYLISNSYEVVRSGQVIQRWP